jgi:hypothetical protein
MASKRLPAIIQMLRPFLPPAGGPTCHSLELFMCNMSQVAVGAFQLSVRVLGCAERRPANNAWAKPLGLLGSETAREVMVATEMPMTSFRPDKPQSGIDAYSSGYVPQVGSAWRSCSRPTTTAASDVGRDSSASIWARRQAFRWATMARRTSRRTLSVAGMLPQVLLETSNTRGR